MLYGDREAEDQMRNAVIAILACALVGIERAGSGQTPSIASVAPATIVQVPSASLNEKRAVTVLLPDAYPDPAAGILSCISCMVVDTTTPRSPRATGFVLSRRAA